MELELSQSELEELSKLTEEALAEKRVELRHTKTREWKEALHGEEDLLAGLLERLKRAASA